MARCFVLELEDGHNSTKLVLVQPPIQTDSEGLISAPNAEMPSEPPGKSSGSQSPPPTQLPLSCTFSPGLYGTISVLFNPLPSPPHYPLVTSLSPCMYHTRRKSCWVAFHMPERFHSILPRYLDRVIVDELRSLKV